jgi:peptidoglycan-N-acetylglucosamine deacetylase
MKAPVAFLAGVAAALGLGAYPAGATGPGPAPLAVRSTSLTQHGRELVWRVQLDRPFSPKQLLRNHESVCLLLERSGNGSVAGRLCIEGPSHRNGKARLLYSSVSSRGPGTAHVAEASITRSSTSELSASFLPESAGLGYRPLRWQVISALRPPACPAPGCVALSPRKPALLRLHTPIPAGCVPSGPAYVTNGPRNRHVIALTFDDGPWSDTPQFLDVLERKHVVATFFQIGDQVAPYDQGGALDRRMLADGDIIGDHTWNYGGDVVAGGAGAVAQINEAAAAIRKATGGFEPCLFRAPGGAVTPALISTARSLGFTTIQWDVDPRDWARPGTDAIYSNVVSNAHNGSIVIQHDGGGDRSETLAALPREIDTLRGEGYQFVTVTDLLSQRLNYK